jgi:regulator of nonsense transcripts 2
MPTLRASQQQQQSIGVSFNAAGIQITDETAVISGGPWEDDEERKFYEDIPDLADFVPKAMLGITENGAVNEEATEQTKEASLTRKIKEEALLTQLNAEIAGLSSEAAVKERSAKPALEQSPEDASDNECVISIHNS